MPVLFTNNATTTLGSSILSTDTSLTVASGQGALFPSTSSGYFHVALVDSSNNLEFVKVTGRSSDTFTIVRAQGGTTARAYNAGDKVELRLIAEALQNLVQLDGTQTISGNKTFSGTSTFSGDADFSGAVDFSDEITVPNQSFGNDSTKAANTAFVQDAISAAYPVGSIYINASSSTNPATLLGFGTWTAFGAGRVLVGLDASNSLFDTAEETGGSADAITVSHTHTATSTDSGHTHSISTPVTGLTSGGSSGWQGANTGNSYTASASVTGSTQATITTTVASTGSSGTNANYQPYITVYMWKRTV
jgi:hypothetical protein